MAIGDRIKTVRGSLSRDKFAPQTGISKTTLVNYETGERNPPSDYLIKILELYPDISPAWLLTGEGEIKRSGELPATPANSDIKVDTCKTFTKINSVELYRAIVKSVHELNKELNLKFTSKDKILTALITYIAFSKDIIPETGKFVVDVGAIKDFIKLLCVMKHSVIGPLDSLNLDNMYNIVSHIMGLVKENALYDKFQASDIS